MELLPVHQWQRMITHGILKPIFFTSNNQLVLVTLGVMLRISQNNASLTITLWVKIMLKLLSAGSISSQNSRRTISTFLENLTLEFMSHSLSTPFIITMLFTLETQPSSNQTLRVSWLEMDAPTGNMTLIQHTSRWLPTILFIQWRHGKQFKITTAWNNTTSVNGDRHQQMNFVLDCMIFSIQLSIKLIFTILKVHAGNQLLQRMDSQK